MKTKVHFHLGTIEVQLGFWVRIYLWLSGQSMDVDVPVNYFKLSDIDIELEGDIDAEAYKLQLEKGNENLRSLAKYVEPYVTAALDAFGKSYL